MYSMKNVFWKFQAKFFKNNCDWAQFLQSSRLLACNFTKNELLHKYFKGFFIEYQNILFPEQLFTGHSWQRVPNTPYVMTTPEYGLPNLFLNFAQPLFPVATELHLHCYLWCLVSLTEWVIVPHLMCYFT